MGSRRYSGLYKSHRIGGGHAKLQHYGLAKPLTIFETFPKFSLHVIVVEWLRKRNASLDYMGAFKQRFV